MTVLAELDIDAIRRAAARRGVAELALFGSGAKGALHEQSDLDFLVDFLPGREDPLDDFCGLEDDLRSITKRDVDLVGRRAIRNPFSREAALAQTEQLYVADV